MPPAIHLNVAQDRTTTIRASVHDVEVYAADLRLPGRPGGLRLSAEYVGPRSFPGIAVPLSLLEHSA